MAARRLLIVMLVFLGLSSVLAVLAPPPVERDSEPSTSSTTGTSTGASNAAETGAGRLIRRQVAPGGDGSPASRISMRPGDQLALLVEVSAGGEVSIPSLGLRETAGPRSPARFDIYASGPGRHPVRVEAESQPAAVIEIKRIAGSKGG